MDRYAVIGTPIYHSLSPRIHIMFAYQTNQVLDYVPIEIKPEDFNRRVTQLADDGFKGLNVTVPLKTLAWEYAAHRDNHADLAEAANVLKFSADRSHSCFNTDGIGLIRDLTVNNQLNLRKLRILILGAGGAVRGVLAPLLGYNPAKLVVANRTVEKARALAKKFCAHGDISGCGFDALKNEKFDLIINGTSAGLADGLPPIPKDILEQGGYVYDMMYGQSPTAFVQWGRDHGASKSLDGLGMLVEQAAESFRIWRGMMPATGPVIKKLRSS